MHCGYVGDRNSYEHDDLGQVVLAAVQMAAAIGAASAYARLGDTEAAIMAIERAAGVVNACGDGMVLPPEWRGQGQRDAKADSAGSEVSDFGG